MKEEIKWITLWIVANTVITGMSLVYLYLSNELHLYGITVSSLYAALTLVPFSVCKYIETKALSKKPLVIKILND